MLAVEPLVGSGTESGSAAARIRVTARSGRRQAQWRGILAYNCQWSDDNKYALCEFVARDRAAFAALLADRHPDVRVFEKGKARRADIEVAFRLLSAISTLTGWRIWVP